MAVSKTNCLCECHYDDEDVDWTMSVPQSLICQDCLEDKHAPSS